MIRLRENYFHVEIDTRIHHLLNLVLANLNGKGTLFWLVCLEVANLRYGHNEEGEPNYEQHAEQHSATHVHFEEQGSLLSPCHYVFLGCGG